MRLVGKAINKFSEHHRGQICSGWCWAYNDS